MTTRKEIAVSFLQLAASGEVERAYGEDTSEGFRHHNPHFPGSKDALARAQKENADQYPNKTFEIQRALEEGDLVAVHSRVQLDPSEPEIAVVHLFRFEGDQITELWDIGAPVPKDSPNENGAF